MLCKQEERGDECRDHPEHQRDGDGLAEHRAHEERQLHVAHAHPGRVGQDGEEEEQRGAERAQRPGRARVDERVDGQQDGRRGQDDAVRDDPVLEVDRGDRDQHGAEERGQRGLGGEPESEHARGDQQRGRQLDGRVAGGDARGAVAAAPAQERVRQQRDVVAGRDLGPAAHAGRGRPDDRAPQRDARGDDVEEAPEREPGSEGDCGEGEVHSAPYRLAGGAAFRPSASCLARW